MPLRLFISHMVFHTVCHTVFHKLRAQSAKKRFPVCKYLENRKHEKQKRGKPFSRFWSHSQVLERVSFSSLGHHEVFIHQSVLSSGCSLAGMLEPFSLWAKLEIPEILWKHGMFSTRLPCMACAMVLGVRIGERELQQHTSQIGVWRGIGGLSSSELENRQLNILLFSC